MNKKIKKIIAILLILIGLIVIVVLINNIDSNKLLISEESIISKQKEYEKKLVSSNYTIDNPNIVLNPYGSSPLTALIIFETKEEVSPILTIVGKDSKTTYSETFEKNTIHYLPVLGLYADYNNEIIIKINNKEYKFNIRTDKLPDDFSLPEYVYSDSNKLNNDLYFFTNSSSGYVCAYDINGDVRWYITNKLIWKIDRLKNGNMLLSTDRLVAPFYHTTGLYEIDMLGKIYTEFSIKGGYHHDYFELDNGNLIVLSNDFEYGKSEDFIIELDRNTGDIVKSIDLKNILPQEDGKSANWIVHDWFHNNSVWYDKATNSITLSGRHQDAVINLNYETNELNWIIGDSTNWSEEFQKYFFTPVGDEFEWQWSQHAAMVLPNGNIFILDNGNNKSKIEEEYVSAENSYTRGVIYNINTDDMTIRQVWQYGKERGSEFYSPYISDVDYINNNHYIVHSGGISYVDGKISNEPAGMTDTTKLISDTVEILNNEVIFEIKLPTNNYRVEKMDLYGNYEFKLNNTKKLGTLGKTIIDNKYFGSVLFSTKIDDVYKSKNIEIKKEYDRLSIKGKYNKNDKVNIILEKFGSIKKYNVIINNKPYTAMCVDVFVDKTNNNEIINVAKYINNEGLNGNYKIYIEINDKIYNTNYDVKF